MRQDFIDHADGTTTVVQTNDDGYHYVFTLGVNGDRDPDGPSAQIGGSTTRDEVVSAYTRPDDLSVREVPVDSEIPDGPTPPTEPLSATEGNTVSNSGEAVGGGSTTEGGGGAADSEASGSGVEGESGEVDGSAGG